MSNIIYSYVGAIGYLIMQTLHESQVETFPEMQAEIDCSMLSNNPRQAFRILHHNGNTNTKMYMSLFIILSCWTSLIL